MRWEARGGGAPVGVGLARGSVHLSPHDPRWAEVYAAEARAVRAALGEALLGMEHVGSTAVPGLDAKPIIDLMAGMRDSGATRAAVPVLERLGYVHREAREHLGEAGPPPYMLLVRGPESRRTHHLRLNVHGGADWTAQILFRDHLRAHPEATALYAAEKRRLAAAFPADRAAYTAGKEPLIRRILEAARAEAGAAGAL